MKYSALEGARALVRIGIRSEWVRISAVDYNEENIFGTIESSGEKIRFREKQILELRSP